LTGELASLDIFLQETKKITFLKREAASGPVAENGTFFDCDHLF